MTDDISYIFKPAEQFPNGIYLFNTFRFESTCFRCGDKTEVWTLYSYIDRQYLRLCLFDISSYMTFSLSVFKPRKDGSIRTYDLADFSDPDAKIGNLRKIYSKSQKPIKFKSEFYCSKCQEIRAHNGTSEWRDDLNHFFNGNCNQCDEVKVGGIHNLWSEVRNIETGNN